MVAPDNIRSVPYSEARRLIHIGDVGIMGPTTVTGRWIVWFGRHWASHCCVFYREYDGTLRICEQTWPEGRTVDAEPYIRSCPSGLIVVYRPKWTSRYYRDKAVAWMLANVPGTPYDKKGIFRSLLTYLPGARGFFRPNYDDAANGHDRRQLYCSGMVSRYLRTGRLDPAHGLADNWTEPSDIAKSAVLDPVFRITFEESEGGMRCAEK
jgi:hypothetical protein